MTHTSKLLALLTVVLVLPSDACNDPLRVSIPTIVPPGPLGDSAALGTLRAGAIGNFSIAYSGDHPDGSGGTGEGVIMVRYMGMVDVAKITVPFNEDVPESAYTHFKPANYIDELTAQKWRKLGIAPSPVCSDEIFIRRAYIDAIGSLPKPEEVLAFLAFGGLEGEILKRFVNDLEIGVE